MRVRRLRPLLCLLLAGLVVGVPAALAVKRGTFRGRVKDGGRAAVTVIHGRMHDMYAQVTASCGGERYRLLVTYPPDGARKGTTARIAHNHFRVSFNGAAALDLSTDRRTITGMFTKTRVTGTISVRGICRADARYSARR